MTESPTIRTRFAPSPSGHLHVGGARTALFCWAYARARGGRFILRIEDTDRKRSSDAASMGFLDDLEWIGIPWDEGPPRGDLGGGEAGPYFASERLETYRETADRLIAEGKAYRAFETSEELDAARQRAREAKVDYRYDRASLHLDEATAQAYLDEDRPYVVRARVPEGAEVRFRDEVRGDMALEADRLDDFVIIKADGYPTYHFAVVVDDESMGVTHVLRAEEHLTNTFKHVVLQDLLGYRRPVYAHLSVITNPDGSKMSKREKDRALRTVVREQNLTGSRAVDAETWSWWMESKDHQLPLALANALASELGVDLPPINVDDFRQAGYLPEVIINYLALLGWSPGGDVEKFDRDFFVERFDFDRLIKSAAKFDRDKLLAFNLDALQTMPEDEFVRRVREHCATYHPAFIERFPGDSFAMFALANRKRSKTLEDGVRSCGFFLTDDESIVFETSKNVRKAMGGMEPTGAQLLEMLLPRLGEVDDWAAEPLETEITAFAEAECEGRLGKVAQPLRIAVTGSTVSPPIFETLVLLGRDSVIRRIERCLEHRAQASAT